MTISRATAHAAASLALLMELASFASAQLPAVTVEEALKRQPKQAGVNISTPTPDQAARCKVSPIPHPKEAGKSMGYLVTDANNTPVRQFVSYDNKNFNIVAFYVDGVEAYREVYPPNAGAPYQFRWLGPNGTKWGLDRDRDGVIDDWAVISPEEASQELMKAVATRDVKRLEALLIKADNLRALGLPDAEADKLKARTATAAKRLHEATEQLKLSDKAKWVHVEFSAPQTRAADSFGSGTEDFTAYKSGTVLIEDNGKNVFLQTGELVQVGRAWKFVDGPGNNDAASTEAAPLLEPQIQPLVESLNRLDKTPPTPPTVEALGKFNAERAALLEQIVAKATDGKKEPWVRMLLDAHAAAAEGGKPDNASLARLREWKGGFAKAGNNPQLAAFAAFRLLQAEQSVALANIKKDDEFGPIQEKWRANLEEFVKAYPTAPDTPEAVWRLAMAWELSGAKDSDAKAKHWFDHLVKYFPTHAHAAKANGALRRLDSEGKPLELTGPLLHNPAQQFSAAQKDKVVVVYFWASWSQSLPDDAKKLDALVKAYGAKGLVVVTVGLDHDAKTATDAAARVNLPGTHLFAPGGLDSSPLAATYGILAPPHLIVAGKDGKITNRNAPLPALEEEVKKLLEAK